LIDLDQEFLKKYGDIGKYIHEISYENYYQENSALFFELLGKYKEDTLFILSSGFFTYADVALCQKNISAIKKYGISIRLLSDKDKDKSTMIVVERQLKRGFGLEREKEIKKHKERFDIYKPHGDIKIYSSATPSEIAEEIHTEIKKYTHNISL
jgi:shikimate kinase